MIIITKLITHLLFLIIIICLHSYFSVTFAHKSHKHNTNLPCQDPASPSPLGYHCNNVLDHGQCSTFALLRANSYFPSLSKLATSLGIDRFSLLQANGFSSNTDFIPLGHPFLIPINCLCNKDSLFGAYFSKQAAKGDSFYSIYNSLQGLTTCNAIRDKNPNVVDVKEKLQLLIPLRCACPGPSSTYNNASALLLTYTVNDGDTISKLASQFNVTRESIVSANINSFSAELSNPDNVLPVFRTLLIPLAQKPVVASLGYSASPLKKKKKKKRKMMYIGMTVSVLAAGIAIAVVFTAIKKRKRRRRKNDEPAPPRRRCSNKMATDVEVQQLSLSIRTTASDKKISFDLRSQDTIDGHIIEAAKCSILEVFTAEELKKATEEFDSSTNLIEGSVFQGRLNGKNLAIKKTNPETISKIDFGFFQDSTHHHPNIIRLIGSATGNSTADASDSFLVFEYAENGSLKDWLHGGLAMKSHFIASCYCFLNWNQRLKICLDVAIALQYMHQIKNPNYVHRNIKSRNIFLDDEFNAKVGNFAMGKCVEEEISSCSPLNRAYLAPEYVKHRIVSPSMDIFAYGVVLMEVLSGRPPVTKCDQDETGDVGGTRMSEKIKGSMKRENYAAAEWVREWMDNALGEEYSIETAVAVMNLAVTCVEDEVRARPSAAEIVEKLSKLAGVAASPVGEDGRRQSAMCESSSQPLVMAVVTTAI